MVHGDEAWQEGGHLGDLALGLARGYVQDTDPVLVHQENTLLGLNIKQTNNQSAIRPRKKMFPVTARKK